MRDERAAKWSRQGSALVMRLMALSVFVVAAVGAFGSAHAREHHGEVGPGMMMFGGPPEHVGRDLNRMLDGLGVSEAQRSQIKQIAMSAAGDLRAQREADRGLREKAMQIFVAPTVDASAAESIRLQMSAQQEQASRRVMQAMLDVAKVLTPEQRARIGERFKERQAMMQDRIQRMHQEHAPLGPRPGAQPATQK